MAKKLFIIALILVTSVQMAHSQVLLSLIFGDNLQTEKLEFGLNGGFNLSTIRGIEGAKGQNNWLLGFYFDIHPKLESPMHISTGVYVKSNVGARNIPLDHPGNPPINDSVYNGFVNAHGSVEKVINTFYVPLNLRYQTKSGLFFEAGGQAGLVFKTRDLYQADVDGYTLHYDVKQKLRNNQTYRWIDAGVDGGIGFKPKGKLGMKIGVWYYLGLVNIYKNDIDAKAYNSSLYVLATFPIGKKKAEEERAKKEAAKATGN